MPARRPATRRYNLKLFSMQLNEVTPGLEARLPPSDTRRRGDLRALEQGRFKEVHNINNNQSLQLAAHSWRP
jgi:hypothetical protein